MPVLERSELQASPLADLHAIADQLGLDGYRRLRKAELIDAIMAKGEPAQDGEPAALAGEPPDEEAERAPAPRRRRRVARLTGGRSRRSAATADADTSSVEAVAKRERAEPAEPRRGGAGELAEGVVELLGNGSAFLRVSPPEPSDEDVYISAAQVKRCELVSGDRISGPRRAPRRSERFASLTRIDTINGRPAEEVADSTRFDDLPAAFPSERFRLGSDDPTITAIESLTPLGQGSRVTIV